MKEILVNSVYFGVLISISGYGLGLIAKKKWNIAVVNPVLIGFVVVIAVLLAFKVDYKSYYEGAKYISYLLTPTTICLAIPLYEQIENLKKNWKAILLGIASGTVASMGTILLLSMAFGFTHEQYVTMLPKSVTTAIGMGISEELGGIVTITVSCIIITGIFGNIIARGACKLFRIKNPVARGVAIGTASHAIGTAKAIEMGEVEGAMSGLSIAVAGVLTVFGAMAFSSFY